MSYVYVLEAQNGMIKIGCSTCPRTRFEAIFAHSPVLIRQIAEWRGARADELVLHKQFHEFRHHNEWFAGVGPVLAFANEVRGRGVDHIPDWPDLLFHTIEERKKRERVNRSRVSRERWADPEFRNRLTSRVA